MVIYGVSFLGACYILGQLLGEFLAKWIGVKANVGGVGFAMLFLILAHDYFNKRNFFPLKRKKGFCFGVKCIFRLLWPCQLLKMLLWHWILVY